MKKTIVLLALLPLLSTAQNKLVNKPLPLIETITSDTIKGKYQEIVFTYDQLNRVVMIASINCTVKQSNNNIQAQTDTTKIQKFEYANNNMKPLSRRIINYDYSEKKKKMVWHTNELQYFMYENGRRTRDSVLHKENTNDFEGDWGYSITLRANIATLEQTDSTVLHNYDLTEPGNPPEIYKEYLEYRTNVRTEATEHIFANNSRSGSYFIYTKFDHAINPFNRLNIAAILATEKIEFGDGTSIFNWHYLNKNNPAKYSITRGEKDSPFKDLVSMAYQYNEFQQPVYCTVSIKIVLNNDESNVDKHYQKHFAFRYKE